MKEIPLTRGKVALVDDEDYEWLSTYNWYCNTNGKGYARAAIHGSNNTKVYMHRLIVRPPDGFDIDHADGNTLNNQRSNLRVATRSQNQINKAGKPNSSSQFKGVRYDKQTGRWRAEIGVNREAIQLGYFDDEIDAARAYDNAARRYYGEFAPLNFECIEF